MDTLPFVGKLAKLTITSYLVCIAREERVEQIHFLLAQYTVESCSIPKCYDLRLKVLSDKTTLVLSNTRELDKVPSTE